MSNTLNAVYIAHLARPLGDPSRARMSARHYTGKCVGRPLAEREHEHRCNAGSRMLAAANREGIDWHISTVYLFASAEEADQAEQLFKAHGHHDQRCAACQALARGEQPTDAPRVVEVASLAALYPHTDIAAVIERRVSRLLARREAAREEERWLLAVDAAHDNSLPLPRIHGTTGWRDDDGRIHSLGSTYGDESTSYPLELVGPDFDLDAWRRGEIVARDYCDT
jgi:hypothetical protein